jgi:hypothetical protein
MSPVFQQLGLWNCEPPRAQADSVFVAAFLIVQAARQAISHATATGQYRR